MRNQDFSGWIETFGQKVKKLRSEINYDNLSKQASSETIIHQLQVAQEELHAAEEELRMQNDQLHEAFDEADAERRRYRELFEFAHDGYIITDARGSIFEANIAAGKMLHIEPGYLVGKPLIRFISGDYQNAFRTELRQIQQTNKTSEVTLRVEPRAAASFYATLKLSAMTNENGHFSGVRWLLRDMAEQVKIQQQIQTLQEEAQQRQREQAQRLEDALNHERAARMKVEAANKAKDHFFAIVSHELRTPLGAVLNSAMLLDMDPSLPAHLREPLDIVRRGADLLDRLTGDFVDLAGIACGKFQVHMELLDLHVIIQQVLHTCQHEIQEKSLTLRCNLSAGESQVKGDTLRLQQVCWNIVRNAIKFSSNQGLLSISTSNPVPGKIRLEIKDTGMGIEPDKIGRIFEIFEQADPEAARTLGGLGLGLTIARNLVAAHCGVINAHSDGKGRGTTFTVELPLASTAPGI